MSSRDFTFLTRDSLLSYFLEASTPREDWQVGMELEKLGRRAADGMPLPYEGSEASVRGVLEFIQARRGGDPVIEGERLIGVDAAWGTISLEPGGQVEWSSRPCRTLHELKRALDDHLAVLAECARELGVVWLDTALDPVHPVDAMPWMPKARYKIMRPYLGRRGGLAHRMMTQTASIQCAYDYHDPDDWTRKFKAAALLSPIAVALFGNSRRLQGRDTGYHSYRQVIWTDTDPDRCGLPPVVFTRDFGLERWLDWILDVPTIFRHRARGLAPAGGVPFGRLMQQGGCDALRLEDWEIHVSSIFTDVRSYNYIEVRTADLQPDALAFAVPCLWTGLLYDDASLSAALQMAAPLDDHGVWSTAMRSAAKDGLDGMAAERPIRELADRVIELSLGGLRSGAVCVGDPALAAEAVESLARHHRLTPHP